MPVKYTPEQFVIAFWNKVNKDGSIPTHRPELGKCWEWTACKTSDGYGSVRVCKKMIGTHRLVWKWTYSEIPEHLEVCHLCDNPACCNPKHLWLGTHKQNVEDRENKKRGKQPRFEKHNKAKLNREIVTEIRQRYENGERNLTRLSKDYNVTRCNIGFIIKRITWRFEE